MKKRVVLNIIFILFCLQTLSQTDIFSGKLIYSFEALEPLDKESIPLGMEVEQLDFSSIEVLVKDDKLITKAYLANQKINGGSFQHKDTAYLYGEYGKKIDFSLMPGDLSKITLIKKTKEKKKILGIPCRKYIYSSDGNRITVWIPRYPKYTVQRKYEKFFCNYFYPDGIGLEILLQAESYDDKGILKKIERIELFNVTEKDFHNFEADIKEQLFWDKNPSRNY